MTSRNWPAFPGRRAVAGALGLFLAAGLAGEAPPAVSPDLVFGGQFHGLARYRFDDYEQASTPGAPIIGVGRASTLRLDLGYQTATWHGLALLAEVNGVYRIGGGEYRTPTVPSQNIPGYPTINDPPAVDLHQLELNWEVPGTALRIKVGRDELQLNNGRFLGNSPWRQTPQTVDLAQASFSLGQGVTATYTYLGRVHRTVGRNATDGTLSMDSHLGNLAWGLPGIGSASAYGLWLDYRRPDQWANSTGTAGLRAAGPFALTKDLGLVYTADLAHQGGYAQNPNSVSEWYWTFEGGLAWRGQSLFAGWTVLGARDARDIVTTPLSPPFNGWVEKFGPPVVSSAGAGLDARYLTLTGPVPGLPGLADTVTYYDYFAASTHVHFANELDLGLEWKTKPFGRPLTIGLRSGAYRADRLYSRSIRSSIYSALGF